MSDGAPRDDVDDDEFVSVHVVTSRAAAAGAGCPVQCSVRCRRPAVHSSHSPPSSAVTSRHHGLCVHHSSKHIESTFLQRRRRI